MTNNRKRTRTPPFPNLAPLYAKSGVPLCWVVDAERIHEAMSEHSNAFVEALEDMERARLRDFLFATPVESTPRDAGVLVWSPRGVSMPDVAAVLELKTGRLSQRPPEKEWEADSPAPLRHPAYLIPTLEDDGAGTFKLTALRYLVRTDRGHRAGRATGERAKAIASSVLASAAMPIVFDAAALLRHLDVPVPLRVVDPAMEANLVPPEFRGPNDERTSEDIVWLGDRAHKRFDVTAMDAVADQADAVAAATEDFVEASAPELKATRDRWRQVLPVITAANKRGVMVSTKDIDVDLQEILAARRRTLAEALATPDRELLGRYQRLYATVVDERPTDAAGRSSLERSIGDFLELFLALTASPLSVGIPELILEAHAVRGSERAKKWLLLRQLCAVDRDLRRLAQSGGRLSPPWRRGQSGRVFDSGTSVQGLVHRSQEAGLVRRRIVAPPDRVFLVADFSAFEPRVAAALSQDEALLSASQATDMYLALGKLIERKTGRQLPRAVVKQLFLGYMNGANPETTAWKLPFEHSDAVELCRGLPELFPRFEAFRDALKAKKLIGGASGPYRYFDGRSRLTQKISHVVQSTATTLFLRTLVEANKHVVLVGQVHDSIIAVCPASDEREGRERLASLMGFAHEGALFRGEVVAGPNLADLK